MNSPKTNVSTENASPTRTIAAAMRVSDTPDARMTVYSEFATRFASAKIVPIRAAIGNRP